MNECLVRQEECERLVQRYHDFAQTHLPSDNKRELRDMIQFAIEEAITAKDKEIAQLKEELEHYRKQVPYLEGLVTK